VGPQQFEPSTNGGVVILLRPILGVIVLVIAGVALIFDPLEIMPGCDLRAVFHAPTPDRMTLKTMALNLGTR
jgi:hypothetical protein